MCSSPWFRNYWGYYWDGWWRRPAVINGPANIAYSGCSYWKADLAFAFQASFAFLVTAILVSPLLFDVPEMPAQPSCLPRERSLCPSTGRRIATATLDSEPLARKCRFGSMVLATPLCLYTSSLARSAIHKWHKLGVQRPLGPLETPKAELATLLRQLLQQLLELLLAQPRPDRPALTCEPMR
jgi:hypothetical protein